MGANYSRNELEKIGISNGNTLETLDINGNFIEEKDHHINLKSKNFNNKVNIRMPK